MSDFYVPLKNIIYGSNIELAEDEQVAECDGDAMEPLILEEDNFSRIKKEENSSIFGMQNSCKIRIKKDIFKEEKDRERNCTFCPKSFQSVWDLKTHVREFHLEEVLSLLRAFDRNRREKIAKILDMLNLVPKQDMRIHPQKPQSSRLDDLKCDSKLPPKLRLKNRIKLSQSCDNVQNPRKRFLESAEDHFDGPSSKKNWCCHCCCSNNAIGHRFATFPICPKEEFEPKIEAYLDEYFLPVTSPNWRQ